MTDPNQLTRYARGPAPVADQAYARDNTLPATGPWKCVVSFNSPADQVRDYYGDSSAEGGLVEPGLAEDTELVILDATSKVIAKAIDDLAGKVTALEEVIVDERDSRLWDKSVLEDRISSLSRILGDITSQGVLDRAESNFSFRDYDDSDFNKTAVALVEFMDLWARQMGGYPVYPRPAWLRPAHEMQYRTFDLILAHLSHYYDLHVIGAEVGRRWDWYNMHEVQPTSKIPAPNGTVSGCIAAVTKQGFRRGRDGSIAQPTEVAIFE